MCRLKTIVNKTRDKVSFSLYGIGLRKFKERTKVNSTKKTETKRVGTKMTLQNTEDAIYEKKKSMAKLDALTLPVKNSAHNRSATLQFNLSTTK